MRTTISSPGFMPFPASATSFFANAQNVQLNKSSITISNTDTVTNAFELLRPHCALTALADSNERFDAPHCAEETREAIIQDLIDWVNGDDEGGSIMWLRGGAGAGKSALAQTFSEICLREEKLAASFFFSRTVAGRSDGNTLIPTLVFQLLQMFPEIQPLVDANLRKDPGLFSKRRSSQMEKLLIEPLTAQTDLDLHRQPLLIIIDGLDECSDIDIQSDILHNIADAIARLPFPIKFLVASRPESHILRTLHHDPALQHVSDLATDLSEDRNAREDIKKYLTRSFQEIRRVHRLGKYLSSSWPSERDIATLVERSSGHFIYASTAMKYIQSSKHRPDVRLQVILGLSRPRAKDSPLAQLDELYSFLFSGVDNDDLKTILCFFGLLKIEGTASPWDFDRDIVDDMLDLRRGDLDLMLDPLVSLVIVSDYDDKKLELPVFRVLHASIFDFLFDSSRAGKFYFDIGFAFEAFAKYCMRKLPEAPKDDLILYFDSFIGCCRSARFSDDTLSRYLSTFDFLYDNILQEEVLRDISRNSWTMMLHSLSTYFCILRDKLQSFGAATVTDLHTYHAQKVAQKVREYLDKLGNGLLHQVPFIQEPLDLEMKRLMDDIIPMVQAGNDTGLSALEETISLLVRQGTHSNIWYMNMVEVVLSNWVPNLPSPGTLAVDSDTIRDKEVNNRPPIEQEALAALFGYLQALSGSIFSRFSWGRSYGLLHFCHFGHSQSEYLHMVLISYLGDTGKSVCTFAYGLDQLLLRAALHMRKIHSKLSGLKSVALPAPLADNI